MQTCAAASPGVYPIGAAQEEKPPLDSENLQQLLVCNAENDIPVKQKLSMSTDLGPALVEHCLRSAGILPKTKCTSIMEAFKSDPELLQQLHKQMLGAHRILQLGAGARDDEADKAEGIIVLKKGATVQSPDSESDAPKPEYEDVSPVMLAQHEGLPVQSFESFDAGITLFHSAPR